MSDRDCNSCLYATRDGGCASWECNFISIAEAEPKHGKWVERQHFYNDEETIDEWQSERCTKCDKYLTTPYRYHFFHHNYCPYCGAKMEEEK